MHLKVSSRMTCGPFVGIVGERRRVYTHHVFMRTHTLQVWCRLSTATRVVPTLFVFNLFHSALNTKMSTFSIIGTFSIPLVLPVYL